MAPPSEAPATSVSDILAACLQGSAGADDQTSAVSMSDLVSDPTTDAATQDPATLLQASGLAE